MAAGVRTRKRQREDGVLDSVELTPESASAFVDQMREGVTQGTIEELMGAVQRASPAGKRALVAKGGLRRFRQWLKELMAGGHVSASSKRPVSVERSVLVDFVLQVLMTIPVQDREDISRSGVANVVGDIADNQYRVIAACAKSARALIEHWAEEHGLADDEGEVEEADEPPTPATIDPRFAKSTGSVSPAQSGIATPGSASSASGHDDDDDDLDDLDELPPMLQLDGDDAGMLPPGFESLDNLDAGLPLAEVLGKPADDAAEELQDHTFFDGRPEMFGKVSTGVLINRKQGIVGGRPWVPRKVALSGAGDAKAGAPATKADAPPEAIKAKQKRKRGIVFAEDMERVRYFLRRAVPTAVSVGNPTEEDFRKSMESDGDDVADDDDAAGAAGSDGNVEERRRREQEREKGLNLRDRLAQGDDDESGELGAAGSKLAQSGAGFPPTHNHVPPPLVAIPAALQRKPVSTKDSVLNDAATAQAFEYHQRNPALAPRTPAVSDSAWQGFQADKPVQQFRAPPLASAAQASPSLAPRRALGGLGGLVAKLTSSRGAVRDDARDASMSRRSASPGESLARSSSVPQAATPAAGSQPVRSSLLSSLSGIMGRVSASQGALAAAPAAAPRAPSVGAMRPSPYAPSPSSSLHHTPGTPAVGQIAAKPFAGGGPAAYSPPVSTPYGAAPPRAVGSFQQHTAHASPAHPSAGFGGPAMSGNHPEARPPPAGAAPPVGSYDRAPYDNENWWHLLPEEMPPVTNRATRGSPCHFFPTIQGCQMGANCGFKHDPFWTPSRAPKGVDRLWPKFLFEILPRRRARKAAAGAAGAAAPLAHGGGPPAPPQAMVYPGRSAPPAGPPMGAAAAPPSRFAAQLPPPQPYGATPRYGAPAAAAGGYAYGGAPAPAPAPSSGAAYAYGGVPAAAPSAPRGYGAPATYGGGGGGGGVGGSAGYAYGGGASSRPSAAPSQYQYGSSGPPAQRPAMAPQYGAPAPAAGYQYGGSAPPARGGSTNAATLNPSAISQYYGSRS